MAEEIVVEPVVAEPVEQPVEPPAEPTMVPLSALEAERKKRQAEREEKAYWKGVAESRVQPTTPPPVEKPKEPQPPAKPARLNAEHFDIWAEYEAAQAKQDDDYLTNRDEFLLEKFKWEQRQESEKQKHAQAQQQKVSTHLERLQKAAELDPEIEDIANNWNIPGKYQMSLSGAMQEAILESELGPEVLRHLYNNKQEAARIARLGQVAAVREMLKIESELNKKTVVKTVSNAPPPITPVRPSGAVDVDDDTRPAADVIREMRERSFKRR